MTIRRREGPGYESFIRTVGEYLESAMINEWRWGRRQVQLSRAEEKVGFHEFWLVWPKVLTSA